MLHPQKLSNTEFMLMRGFMRFVDHVHPHVPQRAASFGIIPGMTVVDYGCGPGRYTVEFCRLVGSEGRVIAVDLLEIALQQTEERLKAQGLDGSGDFGSVELRLAQGYKSGIPSEVADMVCAIDMFHHVSPLPFLQEAYRITKPDGVLLISGGHQTRNIIKKHVAASGLWEIVEDTRHFLKYRKK